MMKATLISATETATILRRKLGAVRAWEDALADMRRGRTSYLGLKLLPYGRLHDGTCHRPYYMLTDIRQFIANALALSTPKFEELRIQRIERDIDPLDASHWTVRKLGDKAISGSVHS